MGTKTMKLAVAPFAALALAGCAPGVEKSAATRRARWNRHPPLQGDVSELGQPRQLADMRRIDALAVIDRFVRRLADRRFAEEGLGDLIDLDPEAEVSQGIVARHDASPLPPVTTEPRRVLEDA